MLVVPQWKRSHIHESMSCHTIHLHRYTGTWDTICRIAREEGVSGFFKGMESKILQTALNAVSQQFHALPHVGLIN